LRVAEGPNALSERTIYRWIEAFEDGDESIEDNPHITIRTIEEEVGISKERIESILHSQLKCVQDGFRMS